MIDHFSQERKISKGLGARAVGAPGFDLRQHTIAFCQSHETVIA
jgi:hypothetical protein